MAVRSREAEPWLDERMRRTPTSQLSASGPDQTPLVDRILKEIVALKAERDRGGHSPARTRELTTWYDEAFGELHRARMMAKAAEQGHGD